MKKRILFYLFLVLIAVKSFGQTVLFTEGWENTTDNSNMPPPGWGIGLMGYFIDAYYMSSGTYPTVSPFEGSRLVDFKSHSTVTGTCNILHRAIPISTVGYNNITIDFEWFTDNGYPACTNEGVTVEYSTDGISYISAGSLWPRYSPINQWVLNTQALPTSASGQPTLYVGFLFQSQNGNDCHMDIMHVNGTLSTGYPIVTTNAATSILSHAATLNGTVNANNNLTTVSFDYGLTTSYGGTVAGIPTQVNGTTNTSVSANITGLQCGTLYHYRVNGVNSTGTANGNDLTFTTLIDSPIATTNAASGVSSSGATLNGTVISSCSSASVVFNWGLTTSYGNTTPGVPSIVYGSTPTTVSANLTGLLANQPYHYEVCATNGNGTNCGSDATFTTLCPSAGSAGQITGPIQVCQGQCNYIYQVPPIPNATGYSWTLPFGGTITSGANTNTITVCYASNAVSGNVSVNGTSSCGNGSTSTLFVSSNPTASPTITGPALTCVGTQGNVYTTQAGMTNYIWTVSGGGIITNGGSTTDNTITITWASMGSKTVCVSFTTPAGCPALIPTCYNVVVNPFPTPTINGTTNLCVNSGYYNYTTESGMNSYTWNISPGGIINYGSGTNTINVAWIVSGAQWINVTYTNQNGCQPINPTQLNVNVNPLPDPAGSINGSSNVCAGESGITYSVTPIPNAITYLWTLPTGTTITSGFGTSSITVSFDANAVSGNITVLANNLCGNGIVSPPFPVSVSYIPDHAGTITGMSSVCQGQTGVVYSLPPIGGATGYVWSLPYGSIPVNGSNTNSITLDFNDNATSGVLSVYGANNCGNGAVSPDFNLTVKTKPAAPVITNSGNILQSNAPNGNQWYLLGSPIAGATDQTYVSTASGEYWDIVTLDGCSSAESNHIQFYLDVNTIVTDRINIYPNPNDGEFTLSLNSSSNHLISIIVYNNLGLKVFDRNYNESTEIAKHNIDLSPIQSGIYLIRVTSSEGQFEQRIIVCK
jgi:hypothetical protein